jgi:hypothetical protein
MNIIILSFLTIVCIVILYFVLERNFSQATTIAQQAGLNEQITFPLTQDSKQFTYSMWIQIDRSNFIEQKPRIIIKRVNEISIEMKSDQPSLLISLPGSTVITIDRFPLQKVVFLTVCVTDKVGADKTKPYSIVDVYVDGKLLKSARTNDVITPLADKGLIAGSGVPADQGIDVTTDVNGPLPPWATIYGLQRWSYYMLPKKVNEEFNRSKLMYKKNFDINLSLLKNEVETNKYKLF